MNRLIRFLAIGSVALAAMLPRPSLASDPADCFYIDNHFHVVDFYADVVSTKDVIRMMDEGKVCRSVMMSLAITIETNPLIDGPYKPRYYLDTDHQMYYNAIQDVNVATAYLALSQSDRARMIPMMNAFNLKDSSAGQYIKDMVRAFPGVWAGFGELHFKKQEFAQKIAGGVPSLYSPSYDPIFKVIQEELGAYALVHCDVDAPGTVGLLDDPYAFVLFGGKQPTPKYRDVFIEKFLKVHNKAPLIWSHFAGMGRASPEGVGPFPDHWETLDKMLGDPAFRHVYIDLSWGPVFVGEVLSDKNRQKTIDLIKKYPDRFIYGSDQGHTADWKLVKANYDVWQPVWSQLTAKELRMITVDNFAGIADRSAANIRAWEAKNGLVAR